tara:strand:- start:138 stop:1106 length:969 start_codon:yes stop_codon:yes gene_type:complete
MKKNPQLLYDGEIDLIDILKIIWDGKIKLLLITLISLLVGFGYNSLIPTNYLNSLSLNSNKNTNLSKIDNIRKLLKMSNISNQLYLSKLIIEIEDYEEFLSIIKNTKKINIKDQEKELFKYVKLLKIEAPKKKIEKYIINLKWHNSEEAQKILRDTLKLSSKNLKERIILELEQNLEFEKKLLLNADRIRLDYLKEQSAIAKELNILDNQIDNINLTQPSVSLNINTADIAYYLRGYKAIDKEIQLIENRDYQNLKLIEQELNSFKAQNVKFADYNVYLMDVKSLKPTKLILIISILLGLMVGILIVLISNAFQSTKASKRN